MFQYLKRCLGMDVLEKQIQFYHKYWMQIDHHFGEMNDHLVEMKDIIKAHDVISEKKALDRHTEIMARLGMVLTALEKAVPHYTVSPMVQTIPLTVTDGRGRSQKMTGDQNHA